MNTLTAARAQMELSLGFHMVFAAVGIAMPTLLLLAEGLWLRTKQPHYLALARKWAKATALLFAIGAVSGTALSFELGLLWPRFMRMAGSVLGPAFALEGYAFFLEAIFVGLYLYGWGKLSPFRHWLAGIPIALSGTLSGLLVVGANAWMQTPVRYRLEGNMAVPVDPLAPFFSPAWLPMGAHSTLSCFIAVGFAVAGIYAVGMLRGRRDAYHRAGLTLSLAVGAVCAVLQLLSGHVLAQSTAVRQPLKLAAAEGLFHGGRGVGIALGGLPDEAAGELRYAIHIPRMLSLLTTDDPNGRVQGLDEFPRELWPNLTVTHVAYQVMVGAGMALLALGALYWLARWRKPAWAESTLMLRAVALASPLGMLALEAGWTVSEVGRQPWIIYGVLRTRDAVTPETTVPWTFAGFGLLYLALGAVVVALLLHLARGGSTRAGEPSPPEGAHA